MPFSQRSWQIDSTTCQEEPLTVPKQNAEVYSSHRNTTTTPFLGLLPPLTSKHPHPFTSWRALTVSMALPCYSLFSVFIAQGKLKSSSVKLGIAHEWIPFSAASWPAAPLHTPSMQMAHRDWVSPTLPSQTEIPLLPDCSALIPCSNAPSQGKKWSTESQDQGRSQKASWW